MSSLALLYGIGLLLWIYSFVSVLMNEFKNSSTKIVWILVLIFVPISCILYPFLKNGQIEDPVSIGDVISFEGVAIWLSLGVGLFVGTWVLMKVTAHFDIHLHFLINMVLIIALDFLFLMLVAAVFGFGQGLWGVTVGRNKNFKTVIKNAKNGIASDQNKLGVMYQNGNYVEKDLAKAAHWYEKAAEKNNAWGLYNLGEMYYDGIHYQQNYSKAYELYLKAAEKNHPEAQNKLGIIFSQGLGVSADQYAAVRWFEKAANSGYSWGQSNLAGRYYDGRGVQQNYQKAYELYKKAAEQKNSVAITKLATMYILGQAVAPNRGHAKTLLLDLYNKKDQDVVALWQKYDLGNI